jgi:CheY-like chemotaxis protein
MEKINQSRPAAKEPVLHKEYKILIADDKLDNLLLLARYLENEGYSYVQAKDGLEALEKIRSENPDLALLDVNMPNKDGFAALSEIRADPALRHIPVIILTAAKSDSMSVQFGLNLGADDYITKPFDRRELLARIRTKLRAKEIEDEIRQQLAAVLQITSDPVLIFDAKTHLSLINPAAQNLFTDPEAKLGKPLPLGPGYDCLLQLLDAARTSGAPLSGKVVWPDERVFLASVTPIKAGSCMVILRDVMCSGASR